MCLFRTHVWMGLYECDCLEHIHGWVWVGVTFQSTFMDGCIFIEDIYGCVWLFKRQGWVWLFRAHLWISMSGCKCLKLMERAALCKHKQAVKTTQYEKKCSILTYILLKLEKCVEKHATSTYQKMAASMERLLVRLLL